jgi:hypothetical protein
MGSSEPPISDQVPAEPSMVVSFAEYAIVLVPSGRFWVAITGVVRTVTTGEVPAA